MQTGGVFWDLLARSVGIYRVTLVAFVLMSSHFHLMVKTPRANLQEFKKCPKVVKIAHPPENWRVGSRGHLLAACFHSS